MERSASHGEPTDIAAEIDAEIAKLDGVGAIEETAAVPAAEDESPGDEADGEHVHLVPAHGAAASESESDVATALADVDTLFARLRAGHEEQAPTATDAGEEVATAERVPAAAAVPEPSGPRRSAAEWRTERAGAIDPLMSSLVKRAKRQAQDDQNALLDSVRRHKGRPTAQQVLGEGDAARDGWVNVLRDSIDRAYGSGRTAAGGTAEGVSDDLAAEAAEAVVLPLRERLTIAIDSGDEGDTGGLVERIGARYREWKNQSLERTLGEVLAAAWTRGVYDAVPDEAVLWWIPAEEGRCSDCDDNALEQTVKGKQFPTGQAFPPAHPGCKCLLAPAGLLEGR